MPDLFYASEADPRCGPSSERGGERLRLDGIGGAGGGKGGAWYVGRCKYFSGLKYD